MLVSKIEGQITRAATNLKGKLAQQKLRAVSLLEVTFLCVIVCVVVFIPVGYHAMKQGDIIEGSIPHLRGHLSGALGEVAATWDKQPLVARRMVMSEETMTGEDVELSPQSVTPLKKSTSTPLTKSSASASAAAAANSGTNQPNKNKNIKANVEARRANFGATDLSRRKAEGSSGEGVNSKVAALDEAGPSSQGMHPDLTEEEGEEALVKEVLQDNPPEEKGEREEWASKQGVHRKENIF